MIGRSAFIYSASFVVHMGVALSVAAISPPVRREATKITIREVKRPQKPKPAEPPGAQSAPPPPPPPAAPAVAKPKPAKKTVEAPAPIAAPAAASGAVPSFGLTLGGAANGGGGIAFAAAPVAAAAPVTTTKTAAPKTLARAKPENACVEALVKPKPLRMPQPVYPQAAREAGIAGKIRVELHVDTQGNVTSARVLEGLGHGLDEAALEAARAAAFEPATLCGAATETTFVIGMRFSL